jgi:hypothetical protein
MEDYYVQESTKTVGLDGATGTIGKSVAAPLPRKGGPCDTRLKQGERK